MSEPAPAPAPQDPPANDDEANPSIARAEQRLRVLGRMTGIGMKLLEKLDPDAAGAPAEAPGDKSPGKDPADAFASISRAVRLTLAMEAKTDELLRQLKAGVARRREAYEPRPEARALEAYVAGRMRVASRMMPIIEEESADREAFENLCDALEERLDCDEAYRGHADQPLRELVERLCKDLCLDPDWSDWDAQAEDWIADDSPPTRPPNSPFHTPSAKPLLNDDGTPRETAAPPPLHNGHDLE
jgi:hypothetical protein